MAIHGLQGILNGQRLPKPRNEYAVPRYRVTLVRENRAIPPSSPLNTSVAAAAVLRPLFAGLDREQFLVCGLDAKHCIIGVNLVSIGSLTLAIVHPREVFKPLILMNAAAWICAHNHPSDDPTPSEEDRSPDEPVQAGRGPARHHACSTISSSPMSVATASLIRAGPVPEGSGTDEPEHPHDRRGAFSPFLDACRIAFSPWQKQAGEEGQKQDRDHGARVVHWPSSRPPPYFRISKAVRSKKILPVCSNFRISTDARACLPSDCLQISIRFICSSGMFSRRFPGSLPFT